MQPTNQPNKKSLKVAPEGNEPVIIVLNNGLVENSYFSKQESDFVKNVKKGIVSLLQVSYIPFTNTFWNTLFMKNSFFWPKIFKGASTDLNRILIRPIFLWYPEDL